MAELVTRFVAGLSARIADIRCAVDEQDIDKLSRIAHQLRGAAGGYGFPSLTESAAAFESRLKGVPALDAGLREQADRFIQLLAKAQAAPA
jgi:HPt (histidine-containing phosphotransfer) domain-containing protein